MYNMQLTNNKMWLKNISLKKPTWIWWAKHRLIIKIARRSDLSAWFETWWQTLRNNNM